jgi:hypothetical protein
MTHGYLTRSPLLAMAAAAACLAQPASPPTVVVSTPLQVNPEGEEWRECSIGVSQTNKLEAMVAAIADGPNNTTKIGTTSVFVLPGGAVLGHEFLPCGNVDPCVMGEPGTGAIWASALVKPNAAQSCSNGVAYGWKSPGQVSIPSPQMYTIPPAVGFDRDRPMVGIGADYAGGGTQRHVVFSLSGNNCGSTIVGHAAVSLDPTISSGWTEYVVEPVVNNNCDWKGGAPFPVVLDSGRIVAVLKDKNQPPYYNNQRPHIVYSDDGGTSWFSQDGSEPIKIDPDNESVATTINVMDGNCQSDPAGDTPYWLDQRKCSPAIAVDRAPEPDHVYVAFYAKSAAGATNTDIWIARSTDGGATWSSDLLTDLMQLTDAMLGVDADPETGVDQVMPAMAVDSCGGLNLMFYDNRFDTDRTDRSDWVDAYYIRITGFAATAQIDHTARLTAETFPADQCTGGLNGFLGHYHHMAASADGRLLWLAYIARVEDPVSGWSGRNCYAHRVQLSCPIPTDLNGDGLTTEPDAVAYTSAWSAQEPEADVNLDWIVNTSDFVTFVDWYQQATE